jgi:hypothetical protein
MAADREEKCEYELIRDRNIQERQQMWRDMMDANQVRRGLAELTTFV